MRRAGGVVVMVVMAGIVRWGALASAADLHDNVVGQEECCEPRHVHLSLGEAPDQMHVVWATEAPCLQVKVIYGTSPWRLEFEVTGSSRNFSDPRHLYGLHHLHRVSLTGLQGATTYFYRPVCNRMSSGPFYFQSPDTHTDWSPQVLVSGELGQGSQLLPLLTHKALSGSFSATLQLGGLSAYFADDNTTKGEQVMRAIQQTAAYLPFMTAPGDYETKDKDQPFTSYSHIFSMPGSRWPSDDTSLWYSFDLGPVHFVSICTAVYVHGARALQEKQEQWLRQDLEEVNKDRVTRPWIVVFGQHPLYCSTRHHDPHCASGQTLLSSGLEELLYTQGVDLILQSHTGGYRRLHPLYKGLALSSNFTNPPAPVHLILGTVTTTTTAATATATSPAAPPPPTNGRLLPGGGVVGGGGAAKNGSAGGGGGAANGGDSSNNTTSSSGDGGDAGKQNLTLVAFEMLNGTEPTYARLHVLNATHAHWQLLSGRAGVEGEEEVLDTLWLVQEKHGPFHLSDLPQDVEDKIEPQLGPDGGSKPGTLNKQEGGDSSFSPGQGPRPLGALLEAVQTHRHLVLGLSLAGLVLLLALLLIACRLRQRRRRARKGLVPRRWDTTDYKYGKTRLSNDVDDDDDDDDFKDSVDDMGDGARASERSQTKRLINGP